jgi:CubicO group peptidase (beta-lactamase class C family)
MTEPAAPHPALSPEGRGYEPTREDWESCPPADLGLDADALKAAIAYHEAHETTWRRDFLTASGRYIGVADEPPAPDDVLGPVLPRGGPSGLVLRGGVIAAEWGETDRVEMSFSIAKSYLSALAGLAMARGLIRSLDDRVADHAPDDGFVSAQNRDITWRHLLQQTSEWEGTLWGKPDTIDHNRDLGRSELGGAVKGQRRTLRAPGTYWEYNDVRVNRLSLSLLRLFGTPLADVLRREIMDPIGASPAWRWEPYRNAHVEIGGARMPSVPGGSHWGGGLWMSTRDHARFGLLVQRRGRWGGRDMLPVAWVDALQEPCRVNPSYGLLWWLNPGRESVPGAPASSFGARGAGSNVIWLDPEHDLVVVARWVDKPHVAPLLGMIVGSVRK